MLFLYFLSVAVSVYFIVYVAKQEVKTFWAGKWKVVERLAEKGKYRVMAEEFKMFWVYEERRREK